jgi:hypothetical protein
MSVVLPPELQALAAEQWGLLTRQQCCDAGLPPDRVDRMLAAA